MTSVTDKCAKRAAEILCDTTRWTDGPISTAKMILLINEAVLAGAQIGLAEARSCTAEVFKDSIPTIHPLTASIDDRREV